MYPLHKTKRCTLFEKIASDTWRDLIADHSVGIQVNEPGTTNRIIAQIRRSTLAFPNIGVWANNGFLEKYFGSDMDIFVETTKGRYVWWALQSKVLRLNGSYEGVSTPHGTEYQWNKLNRLANIAGCEVRYLLYNGVAAYSHKGIDNCNRDFNEDQFGCSLVKTKDVERIALTKTPTFNDFHDSLAQPWRIITCCPYNPINQNKRKNDSENKIYYSLSQIREAVEYYPEVGENFEIIYDEKEKEPVNELPLDAINIFSESIERKPAFRLVVRSTSSLSNHKYR